MLGATGDINSAGSGHACDQAADSGAGMTGRAYIRVVEHGMTEAAHLTIGRGLGLGEDFDKASMDLVSALR